MLFVIDVFITCDWSLEICILTSVLSYVSIVRGQTPPDPRFLVRAGDDVTLPSNRVDQDRCDGSTWFYSRSGSSVELVTLGKINNNALIPEAKTNRLSLTANCSLVIRNVSGEDVGRYTNRDFNEAGKHQGPDGVVSLYVFTSEYLHEIISAQTVHTLKHYYHLNYEEVNVTLVVFLTL